MATPENKRPWIAAGLKDQLLIIDLVCKTDDTSIVFYSVSTYESKEIYIEISSYL